MMTEQKRDRLRQIMAVNEAVERVIDAQEAQNEAIQAVLDALEVYQQWLDKTSKEFKIKDETR